ncbi:molybdopterin-guanine dinucleotide biosynthesis protein A [Azospirillum sp. TSO35-2]|nr:molybdopterin-guanine dinucleotide biosynthesis protein A [Azospirillum sp. TSO35-2]
MLVERRSIDNPWIEARWQPALLVPPIPGQTDWSVVAEGPGWTRYYAGSAEIALFPTETENYKHNLDGGSPCAYVILRPGAPAPGMRLLCVTVDPGEIDTHAEAGDDVIEPLPLPAPLALWIDGFVARHHVERPFHKRKRDRADPEALARRPPAGGEHRHD